LEAIRAAEPEAIAVCAFGQLIREPLLSEFLMLNVHPSLVPRWRGAAPIERAIDAGDERTGVSIMRPTAEMDAGPVCLQRDEPIRPYDTYGTLAPRLAYLGGELLIHSLETHPPFAEQPADGVTEAEKITAEDRRLDPARTPGELERRVRALSPHVIAWVELPGDERMGVLSARAADDRVEPGRLDAREGRLLFGCERGALELLQVKPPGGRAMAAEAWLRGHAGRLA
jgi:methionyl-tRNA formyltransferase